jgi:hypothetical protein
MRPCRQDESTTTREKPVGALIVLDYCEISSARFQGRPLESRLGLSPNENRSCRKRDFMGRLLVMVSRCGPSEFVDTILKPGCEPYKGR